MHGKASNGGSMAVESEEEEEEDTYNVWEDGRNVDSVVALEKLIKFRSSKRCQVKFTHTATLALPYTHKVREVTESKTERRSLSHWNIGKLNTKNEGEKCFSF